MALDFDTPGLPVPEAVLIRLNRAFGHENVGKTGYELEGHTVERRALLSESANGDSNLQYGELLPEGAAKAFHRLGIAGDTTNSGTAGAERPCLLELGMGTGILALQAFLQCSGVADVVGIELSESRCAVAVAAATALATEEPSAFQLEIAPDTLEESTPETPRLRCSLRDVHDRSFQILQGDLTALTPSLLETVSAIFLQVVLPDAVRLRAHQLIQRAPDGCRVFMLEDIRDTWSLPEPSIFHAVDDNAVDRFAASWNARGHCFYVFIADRSRPATITQSTAQARLDRAIADGHEL